MRKLTGLLFAALTLALPAAGRADEGSLADLVGAKWQTYIFVSTRMREQEVLALAQEASAANAVLVLNGFGGDAQTLTATRRYVAAINAICCGKRGSHWIVDPVIARRYHVSVAPSFVVAHGESADPGEFSKVSGDMSLAQALKFVAQQSQLESAREYASQVYNAAYGNRE
jgi:conjugal transfer pilus assembly protein TrbC